MEQFLKSYALGLILFFLGGCSDINHPSPVADPRNLAWDVTDFTASEYSIHVTDVWGANKNDIYVSCRSGSTRRHKLLHFDGMTWSEVDVGQFGSSQVAFDLMALGGTSSSDVWCVGRRRYTSSSMEIEPSDSSLILHYDGISWSEVPIEVRQSGLVSLGIVSPNQIFFGGTSGSLLQFNGLNVSPASLLLPIPDTSTHSLIFGSMSVGPKGLTAALNDFTTGDYYLYLFSMGQWTAIDSGFASVTKIWSSPEGIVLSALFGQGILTSNGLTGYELIPPSLAVTAISGTSLRNIFIGCQDSRLFHFNGVDWFEFTAFREPGTTITGIWTDGEELFVISSDGFKSQIHHGK